MSALRKQGRSKAPRFSTYTTVDVDVDVDIDPEELEDAGWVYVGKDRGPDAQSVLDIVRAWHDDAHDGPWRWCPERPCDTLRGREPNGKY